MDLLVQVHGDVVLDQHVAAVCGQLGELHLRQLDRFGAAQLVHQTVHGGRVILAHQGGREAGPVRLPVARLGNEDGLRAELQHRPGFGRLVRFGESEQVDVEPARRLTQQVEDADRASVRQRIREVGRKDRDPATPGGRCPPLQNTVS